MCTCLCYISLYMQSLHAPGIIRCSLSYKLEQKYNQCQANQNGLGMNQVAQNGCGFYPRLVTLCLKMYSDAVGEVFSEWNVYLLIIGSCLLFRCSCLVCVIKDLYSWFSVNNCVRNLLFLDALVPLIKLNTFFFHQPEFRGLSFIIPQKCKTAMFPSGNPWVTELRGISTLFCLFILYPNMEMCSSKRVYRAWGGDSLHWPNTA